MAHLIHADYPGTRKQQFSIPEGVYITADEEKVCDWFERNYPRMVRRWDKKAIIVPKDKLNQIECQLRRFNCGWNLVYQCEEVLPTGYTAIHINPWTVLIP